MAPSIPCLVWVEFPPGQLVLRPINPSSRRAADGRRSPATAVPIGRWSEESFPVVLLTLKAAAETAQNEAIQNRPIALNRIAVGISVRIEMRENGVLVLLLAYKPNPPI